MKSLNIILIFPLNKMKLQQMKQGIFFITLPVQIVRAKGWNKQDKIQINISDKGDLLLRKVML